MGGSVLYDTIFISNNTVNGADLNKSTGKFTAGADGVYKVMFAMEILSVTSEEHEVCLVKNGERIEESKMHSDYNVYGIGTGSDNGSRELFLNLKAEDTVGLIHESSGSSQLISVTFCVTAINPEMSTDSCIGDCPEKSIRNCHFIKK